MKCDEERPACGRCVRAKAQCPGYQKAIRWSRKHEFLSENESSQQETQLPSPTRSSVIPTEADSLLSITEEDITGFASDLISHKNYDGMGESELNVNDWLGELVSFGFPKPPSELGSSQHITGDEHASQSTTWLRSGTELDYGSNTQTGASGNDAGLLQLDKTSTEDAEEQSELTKAAISSTVVTPILPGLTDTSTLLSDFYFQETAGIFSVYDGGMNPFRSLVARLWTQSRVIFCAMQSMAATGLESLYPFLGPIGKQHRQETVDILMANEDCDETSLLALLMIGASSSWHDPTDSGVSLFNSFQNRMQRAIAREYFLENSNNYRFFDESLVYWQMLLSFVVDDFKMGSYQMWANPL
jgi:hypothetical protein